MASDLVIKVEKLSKKYTIRHQGSGPGDGLRHVLEAALAAPFKGLVQKLKHAKTKGRNRATPDTEQAPNFSVSLQSSPQEDFWALKNVSLEVKRGEVVGIIGGNGAGKSTLLKILSRITEPTRGRVGIKGRLATLLEVGTGFHAELTGRENVFLNGAILGMSRQEVKRKFDEIVDFARVEKFLDTPVKHYSSGMYVRLAFAVAAHLEPEILAVDEVLAVGDAAFQKKCLGKMGEVAKKGGRTVLFVSHNMQAISSLCSRAILLNGGQILKSGCVKDVVDSYLGAVLGDAPNRREQVWDGIEKAPGNDKIRIRRIAIILEEEGPNSVIDMTTPFRVEVDYWNLVPNTTVVLAIEFFALDGSPVFESLTTKEPHWSGRPFLKGLYRSTCFVPGHLLNAGDYTLRMIFVENSTSQLYDFPEAATISITNTRLQSISYYGRFIGHVHPLLPWRTTLLQQSS